MIQQFARFVFVGAMNTVIGLLVIVMAIRLLAAGPVAANAAGFLAGFLASFVLNARITFKRDPLSRHMFGRFAVVYMGAYVANVAVMWLSLPCGEYVAEFVGMAVYTLVGFVGCRLFVFQGA